MAKKPAKQLKDTSATALGEAQAKEAGVKFEWHFGRITRIGNYEVAEGRGVSIVWEEGGVSSHQGSVTDDQWEIFKLAFTTTGRIAILSDLEGEDWMYDYRILEAVR